MLRRFSSAVATSREGHRSPGLGRGTPPRASHSTVAPVATSCSTLHADVNDPRAPRATDWWVRGFPIPTSQHRESDPMAPRGEHCARSKMSFETGVAQCDTGEWCWAARGRDLFVFGLYTTEGAARREPREFVRA